LVGNDDDGGGVMASYLLGTLRLSSGLLEVGDQVVPVLGLLQATEGHLGARDVLLRVLEVFEQGVLLPGDTLGLVGVGV